MIVKYLIQNPRSPPPEGIEDMIGIEYTLDPKPRINIDPQHSPDSVKELKKLFQKYRFKLPDNLSAASLMFEVSDCILEQLEENGVDSVTLVTVRPDVDALVAMGVFRVENARGSCHCGIDHEGDIDYEKVKWVSHVDTHGLQDQPEEKKILWSALSMISFDRELQIEEKVAFFDEWVREYPKGINMLKRYIAKATEEREEMREVTHVSQLENFVFVISPHRGAIGYGYEFKEFVVAFNPEFKDFHGNVYPKWTIAKRNSNVHGDLKALAARLNVLEGGTLKWGGSDTIIGSPQGVASNLSEETILSAVQELFAADETAADDDRALCLTGRCSDPSTERCQIVDCTCDSCI